MMLEKLVARGSSLALVNAFDVAVPLLRMLVLSRFLDLRELGIASLLVATYATLEQVTDIAMYRFVLGAPREHYQEALAAAHALSALRGLVVGGIAIVTAPLVARTFSLGSYWPSFAMLGVIVMIRSLEHLAPRIAERDYQYGPELKSATVASALSLAALFISLVIFGNHVAAVMSFLGQAIGFAVGSRIFSGAPYRWLFRTPYFMKAFKFGYPLMFNGVGLAVSAQADRFLVGGIVGLPALGVYSVLTLTTFVPGTVVTRIINTVGLAMLLNAGAEKSLLLGRLRLASRLIPLIGALFALGILTLANIVVPAVFGRNFSASPMMIVLLALAAFIRIARIDPGTAILLIEGRTKRLALANLVVGGGLVVSFALMVLTHTIEGAAMGKLIGEIMGLGAMLWLARAALRGVIVDSAKAIAVSAAVLGVVSALTLVTPVGMRLAPSLAALAIGAAILALLATRERPLAAGAGFKMFSRSGV